MALRSLKAECVRDEPRMDGAHARVERLSDEKSSEQSSIKSKGSLKGTIAVVLTLAAIFAVVVLLIMTSIDMSHDVLTHHAPVIDSYSFVKGANGMMFWINASDVDDRIVNVTVLLSVKPLDNSSFGGPPVLERVYWINQSSAAVTDFLALGGLADGDYRIQANARDELGLTSGTFAYKEFSLP